MCIRDRRGTDGRDRWPSCDDGRTARPARTPTRSCSSTRTASAGWTANSVMTLTLTCPELLTESANFGNHSGPGRCDLATVGRLPQGGCPAGLVNPCRGSPGRSGSAATGWTPRPAARAGRGEQVAEHSEGVLAVFAGGGQVGADREERPGTGLRPPAAGDLLLQLHHPHVALGLVVVEGHPEVAGEAQHVVAVPVQPGQQRGGRAELGPAALAGPRWGRVEPLA